MVLNSTGYEPPETIRVAGLRALVSFGLGRSSIQDDWVWSSLTKAEGFTQTPFAQVATGFLWSFYLVIPRCNKQRGTPTAPTHTPTNLTLRHEPPPKP